MRKTVREDLERDWTLGPDELALIAAKREGATRLGFAVLLRFFAREGRFPDFGEVGEEAVGYVGDLAMKAGSVVFLVKADRDEPKCPIEDLFGTSLERIATV